MSDENQVRRRITIDPVTRLEGHGKIDIFLDEQGEVERAYFQVPELRGFEKFVEGRPAEDMPQITSRICGVCPTAHHMAAVKALDDLYQVDPPPAAKRIRELVYSAFMAEDHALHFYFLGGPNFIVGPTAPAAERNVLGVIAKVGVEVGQRVIAMRRQLRELISLVGGKVVHPVLGLPGGVAKRITPEDQARFRQVAAEAVDFAQFTLESLRKHRPEEFRLREPHSLGHVHPSHLLHGISGRTQPRQLLRWLVASRLTGWRGVGEVSAAAVPRLRGGTRRALDLHEVLLSEAYWLEGVRRWCRKRCLLCRAAGTAERRRWYVDASGAACLRAFLRHDGNEAGPSHVSKPLGARGGTPPRC